MSGIAGIIHFDGRPVEPGQIESMTTAMAHRGPDGITHWHEGFVALGQCMLRTTPESLEEYLPLKNDDGSLLLVMDGRVDNFDSLRQELRSRGVSLRSRADAELVLQAYETWGEACVHHIVGECVFFIWDARRRTLFAGRDAAGARHFYFHAAKDWFAFASEIKGLLALPQIERRLNEARVLDYLLPEFDRSDQVGTFWRGIERLPAGHALRATPQGVKTWRWWQPAELSEQKFASMTECTEAFMDELRGAVRCRLRSNRPVGAMLSGGLDSSTIVGLISKEFRHELQEPLHTISLIREDREECSDWHSVNAILKEDPWLRSHVITSAQATDGWERLMQTVEQSDEPFAFSHGLTYHLTYQAAGRAGCGVLLDGMAGDLLFYNPSRSMYEMVARRDVAGVRDALAACSRHGWNGGLGEVLRMAASLWAPASLKTGLRKWRQELLRRQSVLRLLEPKSARAYLNRKHAEGVAGRPVGEHPGDQQKHAATLTTGIVSFAHETYGLLAFAQGVEPRSPYSDRRLMEFAVRMPLGAKLALPWYKHVLRQGSANLLPDAVRWRTEIAGHPGWRFYEAFAEQFIKSQPMDALPDQLSWLKADQIRTPNAKLDPLQELYWRLLKNWAQVH